MALKNYTTKVSVDKTVSEIHSLLTKHGAASVITEANDGRIASVMFTLDGAGCFRLPARIDAVMTILDEQGIKCDRDKAERIAWRNIKDWIDAQIALVETGQVELTEVMLPYMLDRHGKTLYQALPSLRLEGGFDD